LTQAVSQASTTTTLASSLNPSAYEASVTFTATISPSVPAGESVTFYDNGASIGTGKTAGGVATLTTSTLPIGADSVTATYVGDADYVTSSSAALTQTVTKAPTTTTLTSSLNPSPHGASVTFTATVGPSVPNDETVSFYDGAALIGRSFIKADVATITTSTLPAGSDSITAAYVGDATYATSTSSVLTQTVTLITTTTTLTSSVNPSTYGQAVTFTASVSPTVPNGETVTFYNAGVSIGKGETSGGQSTLATSTLPAGSDSITAIYGGDANYASSASTALAQTVSQISTTTTLATSLNPSTYGASVTFTATVSPTVPAGETVTFYDNGVSIGTGKTSGATATLTTSTLPTGSDSITATYGGDGNYTASTSSILTQAVNQVSTTITLTSSLNPSTYGQSVTFTATLTPSVTLAETVSFYDGATKIGSGFINGGVATLAISSLPVGSDSITATYGGDANYTSSTSSALTQTVNQIATTITLASSLNPSAAGEAVTFTATISPSVPNDQSVTFYSGGVKIGTGWTSGGIATWTTSSLAVGSDSITATYGGSADYAGSTSSALAQIVS
jgi:hypothetical protein